MFTGTRIDDALYEELESALLMADAGVQATQFLLDDLKRRVKENKATEPMAVKALLAGRGRRIARAAAAAAGVGEAAADGDHGGRRQRRGKTTSIGKADAPPPMRPAEGAARRGRHLPRRAREQLLVWADRNRVEIVSQEGGDPAAVTFDAVVAGRAAATW